jgi:hypothetical protein
LFKRWGWIYRPVSAVDWALTLAALLPHRVAFVVVDRHSHSASDALIGTFPWAWIFVATLLWVASRTSGQN